MIFKKKDKTEKPTFYKINEKKDCLNPYDIIVGFQGRYQIYNYTKETWEPINVTNFNLKKISKFDATETIMFRELGLKKMLYQAEKIYEKTQNKLSINLLNNDTENFLKKVNFENLSIESRILKYLLLADKEEPIDIIDLENSIFTHDIILMFILMKDTRLLTVKSGITNQLLLKYIDEINAC